MAARGWLAVLLVSSSLSACVGRIGDPSKAATPNAPVPGPVSNPTPQDPNHPSNPSDPNNPTNPNNPPPPDYSFRADPAAAPSATPLRRLSVLQYKNTLVDLFKSVPGFDPIAAGDPGIQSLPADDSGPTFTGLDARLSDRHIQAFYLAAD